MAQSGMFRSSLHGFHRQDVLDYISALQSAQAEREIVISRTLEQHQETEEKLQEQVSALTAALEETTARMTELEQLAEERGREALALREQAAEHTQTAEKLRQATAELNALRSQAAENDQAKQQLAETLTHGERLAAQSRALEQENARLNALLGTIRQQTEALRAHGQNFVAASYKYSDDRLTELEDTISALEQKLGETRGRIGEERARLAGQVDTAGIRLQELIHTIENGEPSETAVDSAENAETNADRDFFRNAATVGTDD